MWEPTGVPKGIATGKPITNWIINSIMMDICISNKAGDYMNQTSMTSVVGFGLQVSSFVMTVSRRNIRVLRVGALFLLRFWAGTGCLISGGQPQHNSAFVLQSIWWHFVCAWQHSQIYVNSHLHGYMICATCISTLLNNSRNLRLRLRVSQSGLCFLGDVCSIARAFWWNGFSNSRRCEADLLGCFVWGHTFCLCFGLKQGVLFQGVNHPRTAHR